MQLQSLSNYYSPIKDYLQQCFFRVFIRIRGCPALQAGTILLAVGPGPPQEISIYLHYDMIATCPSSLSQCLPDARVDRMLRILVKIGVGIAIYMNMI